MPGPRNVLAHRPPAGRGHRRRRAHHRSRDTRSAAAPLGRPGHPSRSVAVIFFGWEGLAGSTDPTTSHVTEAVLHAFVVSPLTLAFTVVLIPCGSDATPGTVTGVDAPVGGQVGSFLNTLSLTTQFARSAVPAFISSMSTSLLPLASGTRQVLVHFSPGVRHWNFAMSFA